MLWRKKEKTTENICSVSIDGRLFGHCKNIQIHSHMHLSIFSLGTGDNRKIAEQN